MSKVVTANTLATGTVVFLAADGSWVPALDAAQVFADADTAEEGLDVARRDAERALIVDPFLAETGTDKNGKPAMSMRDSIRAFGPTIKFAPDGPAAA